MKPWKSGQAVLDVLSMPELQWGHGDEAVEEAWHSYLIDPNPYELQWGHGDEAVEEALPRRSARTRDRCFNGATAMKPWKSHHHQRPRLTNMQLQWGHGDEAVEENTPRSNSKPPTPASMGPRR